MSRILVSGLINIETTLRVDRFPIDYSPVRYPFHGVNLTISGVGYNVAKALTKLGDEVRFLSIIGRDSSAQQVRSELALDGIPDDFVLTSMAETARSVILYDGTGKRQINVDLKDIQQKVYPLDIFEQAAAGCDLVALCNINFSRPMLSRARKAGKLIATDVHAISDLNDEYNQDFMKAAHILFMSDESLPTNPEEWARQITRSYGTEILVIGLGQEGVLLSVPGDHFLERIPAMHTRPVVNTIGAGDALFSAFVHAYVRDHDPYRAIRKAIVFASYKIGEKGAAEGFLGHDELEVLCKELTIEDNNENSVQTPTPGFTSCSATGQI
jgi:sugar/nucleoside kinase (ribokinase family)